MKKEIIVNHKKVFVSGQENAECLLIQPVDQTDKDTLDIEVKNILSDKTYTLICFCVEDWNKELSPWKAKAVYKDNAFGDGAEKTLSFILNDLLPLFNGYKKIYLGGYSLAGLFCLWSCYQTDVFDGVAACSPSVWFENWPDYVQSHPVKTKKIYLSLGRKEEKTRHPLMKTVGDNIRFLYDYYQNDAECIPEWNEGNHFTDPEGRTAKGFSWLLKEEE